MGYYDARERDVWSDKRICEREKECERESEGKRGGRERERASTKREKLRERNRESERERVCVDRLRCVFFRLEYKHLHVKNTPRTPTHKYTYPNNK